MTSDHVVKDQSDKEMGIQVLPFHGQIFPIRRKNILLVSARVDFDPLTSIYFIFSNFPRSRNITAPHQIFVGISLIFEINGI